MHRIISTCGKLISKCVKRHPYEMALYNQKPHTSTSIILRQDEGNGKRKCQINEIKRIGRSSSTMSCLAKSCYDALKAFSGRIHHPIKNEKVNDVDVPVIKIVDFLKLLAKSEDSGNKDPAQPGRLGRLDAANEAGFFHRTDRSRLKKIKKTLKDKPANSPTEPKKTG